MRQRFEMVCPRCGVAEFSGVGVEVARVMAATHVCPDGVRTTAEEPVERWIPGPGERTKLPEERTS